jgi:hypothetical protein
VDEQAGPKHQRRKCTRTFQSSAKYKNKILIEKVAKHEGPPNRPDQDVQVEQFLRKQCHSKSGDRMPNSDSKD